MPFAELCALSNFTFLRGASHPEEMAREAAALGLQAIAIADENSVAGLVRAHRALRDLARETPEPRPRNITSEDVRNRAQALDRTGEPPAPPSPPEHAPPLTIPRLIPAARLVLEDGQQLVALPTDRPAWGRLCRLLTTGKRRSQKGKCRLTEADVVAWSHGLILLWIPPAAPPGAVDPAPLRRWTARLPGQIRLLAHPLYDGQDSTRFPSLARLSSDTGAPMVASAAPIMHRAARRRVADILACIREKTTIDVLGRRAQPNAERRLRPESELRALFRNHPEAVDNTLTISELCAFSLDQLRYEYPDEVAGGEDPQTRLERLAAEGLAERYPDGVPPKVRAQADHELALIWKLNYAPYFLTVRDLVAFAESRSILCQGRGSAANSVVCYALRVTAIGPEIGSMVFERFVSEARDEPPDIDVDFEHERREEVIQHIYDRYGRHRAGLCATVIHYRARRAIREVGAAMGLSADAVSALASQIWGWSAEGLAEDRIREAGLDPDDPRLRRTLELASGIIGFPRHFSQHVGGFVITRTRLDELVPIENAAMEARTVIEWDKDDIDALGILKVDVLSLGMLTCIRKCFDLIENHAGRRWTLSTLPAEDPQVYDMLCDADSLGVFQVESRAQMNFLPRLRPRRFYDLVIQVAIVRPGPIQGDMVHPYLRRRRGEEPVEFPSTELGEVLGKTLGVPLFQEQAMQIAILGAGFTPLESDRLRRALATFRKSGTIHTFRARFIEGMLANGHDPDFAERCFAQIEGFGEYGFPESHAASFALLVYASAWLKRHHPAAFACALLNSQPMGFYAPAQIVRDAQRHGVEVRPVCVNSSFWDNGLEPAPDSASGLALRLGFRQVRGLGEEDGAWIAAARSNGYAAVEDVQRKAGVPPAALVALAEADAFAGLDLSRREALWQARALKGRAPPPLFAGLLEGEGIVEPSVTLPETTLGEEVVEDHVALRLSLRAHPLSLLRDRLTPPGAAAWTRPRGCLPAGRLGLPPERARVTVAGLVIVRQRPGSARGVIFVTLEDETGVANVVIWTRVYERFRRRIVAGRLLRVTGRVQRDSKVVHVVAEEIEDLSPMLDDLARGARALPDPAGPADEARRPLPDRNGAGARHPRQQARKLFPSHDFH